MNIVRENMGGGGGLFSPPRLQAQVVEHKLRLTIQSCDAAGVGQV